MPLPGIATGGIFPPASLPIIATDDLFSQVIIPWAPVGLRLSICDDGTITGNTVFTIFAGDAFGIAVQGSPFLDIAIAAATLVLFVVPPISPSIVYGSITVPGLLMAAGADGQDYSLAFYLTTTVTSAWQP